MTEAEIPQTENYTVEAILGKGGMGVVYLAFDKRLNRKVAIKCIRHNRANENWVEAVTEEARLLAQINHRNIVHIYDLIDWQGSPALVMEYLQGRTLLDIFRSDELMSGELDLATRLDWLRQIAEGLACAHAKGIIHRDLKAENIMITDEGTVKIMDFGIARHQAQPLHANIHDSQVLPGEFIGSPAALSPEQAMGDRLTTASDIFSFGILAYCLLCGHHPFGDPKNADLVLQGIIYRPPMPVQFLECLGVADEDAQALGAEIIACLNKAPGMRPAASACVTALSVKKNVAEQSLTKPPVEQSTNKRPWQMALLLLVPLVIFGIFSVVNHSPARHIAILSPHTESAQTTENPTQSMAAVALSDTLYQALSGDNNLIDPSEWNGETDLEAVFSSTGATHIVKPEVACTQSLCTLGIQLYSKTEDKHALEGQREWQVIADSIEDIFHTTSQNIESLIPTSKNAPTLNPKIYSEYLELLNTYINSSWFSPEEYERLVILTESNPTFVPAAKLRTKASISHMLDTNESGRLSSTLDYIKSIRQNLSDSDDAELLTKIHIALGNFSAATEQLDKLRVSGSSYQYHTLHTDMLIRQNKFDDAIHQLNKLISARKSAKNLYSKAYCQFAAGDMNAAQQTLKNLLDISPQNQRGQSFLAGIQMAKGQYTEAIETYETLIRANPHPADINNLAIANLLIGNFESAEKAQTIALKMSPNQSVFLVFMGEIQLALGNQNKAEYFFHKALKNIKSLNDIESYLLAATANIHLRNYAVADLQISAAKNIDPGNPQLIYTEALWLSQTSDTAKAIELVKRSLDNGYGREWFSLPWFSDLCSEKYFYNIMATAGNSNSCSSAKGTLTAEGE